MMILNYYKSSVGKEQTANGGVLYEGRKGWIVNGSWFKIQGCEHQNMP